MALTLSGLTHAEVAQRIRVGKVNRTPGSAVRDYAQIVGRNLVNWFNAMVVPAAIGLFFLNEFQGAIAVSGMAIVNSALGLAQEIRAKRHLDKLAILVESKARVMRDGKEVTIAAGDVVLGDTVLVRSGETIVADGPVLEEQYLEIDEALLTGESDPVRRHDGDQLLSGSVCVAGQGAYRADKVGAEAFANETSIQARRYHFVASPMTKVINHLVQALSYIALFLIGVYTISYFLSEFPKLHEQQRDFVRMVAATITSMVPQGLVLTATVSFTLGAMRMSSRGAVVQRLNAVEAMAAVDVICTDKTGTLTTNRLRLEKIHLASADLDKAQVEEQLRQFASAAVDQQNKNIQALVSALGTASVEAMDQIPFQSRHRYSAVQIRVQGAEHILVLGAFESLREHVRDDTNLVEELAHTMLEMQEAGLRVLCFACIPAGCGGVTGKFPQNPPRLPDAPLQPLALVCLADELRPDAGQVLEALHNQGIAFKILSGDNPATVRATIAHLPLELAHQPVLSGQELAKAPNKTELIRKHSVFGRVDPMQKVEIVQALKDHDFRVAMIGDGVNDVLPIKRADLGIAMGEGSQASKTVAGLVLQNNNFALLPETLEEGRTIVRNLRRSGKLFLVKNVYSLLLILAWMTGAVPFPYIPQQVTLLNWLVIGIPAFVIALSKERSTSSTRPRFLREVGWFALRTGILFAAAGLVILSLGGRLVEGGEHLQRTMLLSTLILLSITALFRALKDGEEHPLHGDKRFRLLAVVAIPVYLLAMYWPLAARFFDLAPLGMTHWLAVALVAGGTYLLTLASDWTACRLAFTSPGMGER